MHLSQAERDSIEGNKHGENLVIKNARSERKRSLTQYQKRVRMSLREAVIDRPRPAGSNHSAVWPRKRAMVLVQPRCRMIARK